MSVQNCPCGQGQYAACCQPLHEGVAYAQTAAQLMRSRYSAFAKQEIDYIVKTTALGQQQALDVKAIADWSKANQWLKLEIVQTNEKIDKISNCGKTVVRDRSAPWPPTPKPCSIVLTTRC